MRTTLAAVLAVAVVAAPIRAADLGIGDPAPKLEVKEFVKGEPVKEFEKGKIYVVEFWATWCGPCKTSIPHLTALQKEYKDVVFIGVSVSERDPSKVKPFVETMGDKMDYRVALDLVEKGEGKMNVNWMEAADQDGIPAAFVVNGDGKIAWIGHPMEMDKPLAQIVAGKWDIAKAKAEVAKAKERQAKLAALAGKLQKAAQGKDPKKVLSILDEAIKDDPEMEATLAPVKLQFLQQLKDDAQLKAYATHLLKDDILKDDAQGLNNVAWTLVEKPGDKPDPALMKLALKGAQRADELLKGKDPYIADTLAKAYYETGDPVKALETQERALKMIKGTMLENDHDDLLERLELYKKAAKK